MRLSRSSSRSADEQFGRLIKHSVRVPRVAEYDVTFKRGKEYT